MSGEDKSTNAISSSSSSQGSRIGTEINMTPEMFRAFGMDPASSSDRADTAAKSKENGGHSSKAASNETERAAEGSNK
ncbi:hypothetical protein V866_008599 [Kwoniella sp. B9012]